MYCLLIGSKLIVRWIRILCITQGYVQFEVHQLQKIIACRERRIALKEILIEIRLLAEQLCTLYANNTGSKCGNQCCYQETKHKPLCNRNLDQRIPYRGNRRKRRQKVSPLSSCSAE